ncbi:glycosyltransferase family 2 protein [Nitrososphaera sp.]|uniref:glycosyltransferase family 2 protein n=1 Tax=Nitrososphaera sp. TaxID=1971748 RepID=UPI00307F343D
MWIGGLVAAFVVWAAVLATTPVLRIGMRADDGEPDLLTILLSLLVLNVLCAASTMVFVLGAFIAFYGSAGEQQRKTKAGRLIQMLAGMDDDDGDDDDSGRDGSGDSGRRLGGLVSIIIPARNREAVIRKSASRCLRQTYRNIEVIVVCHNCSDRTFEEAQMVQDRRVRAFSLTTAKAGKGAALNFGVKVSRGRHVLVLDADCYLPENFIEDALAMFARRGCAAVHGRYVPGDKSYSFVTWMLALAGGLRLAPVTSRRFMLDRRVALGGTAYIIDRDALLEAGGFENHPVDDYELTSRLLQTLLA